MIIERISPGMAPQVILEQLARYETDGIIGTSNVEILRRYVLETCKIPVGTRVIYTAPHQRTILPHENLAPSLAMRGTLQCTLERFMVKLQTVWRDAQRAYVHWQEADLPTPPSQYIAFQQLRFRFANQIKLWYA